MSIHFSANKVITAMLKFMLLAFNCLQKPWQLRERTRELNKILKIARNPKVQDHPKRIDWPLLLPGRSVHSRKSDSWRRGRVFDTVQERCTLVFKNTMDLLDVPAYRV